MTGRLGRSGGPSTNINKMKKGKKKEKREEEPFLATPLPGKSSTRGTASPIHPPPLRVQSHKGAGRRSPRSRQRRCCCSPSRARATPARPPTPAALDACGGSPALPLAHTSRSQVVSSTVRLHV
uniref:Uncharacterized protein n=1 Tax=Oryza glumipatula TaxID=40148 RepID=A0A0E0A6S7_9ORYZ